jgi:hypothetical protein
MRQTLVFAPLLLVLGCGNDNGGHGGVDMSLPAPGPDMAVRVPNGVVCDKMTCAVGKVCCVMTSGAQITGSACIASDAPCTGARIACDGPEDCTSADAKNCCGTIQLTTPDVDGGTPMISGGGAMCASDCAVKLASGSVSSRLCSLTEDCAGFAVTTPIGPLPLDQCCSIVGGPALHFCASSLLSRFGVQLSCEQ